MVRLRRPNVHRTPGYDLVDHPGPVTAGAGVLADQYSKAASRLADIGQSHRPGCLSGSRRLAATRARRTADEALAPCCALR